MLSRTSSMLRTIWKKMKNKEYRDAFVAAQCSSVIAGQITSMRQDRNWTQVALADKAGMKQSRISALEDPDFENVSITTLRRLASAFGVALSVRFVPFSELARQTTELEPADFVVCDYDHDFIEAAAQSATGAFEPSGADIALASGWKTITSDSPPPLSITPIPPSAVTFH